MIISVTPGRGISNRKILVETNKYFGVKDSFGYNKRIIPIQEEGMVVSISPYNILFDIFDKEKNRSDTIKNFLEYIFKGKTIGISLTHECEWIYALDNVNIKFM